jgi:hypothetical protein
VWKEPAVAGRWDVQLVLLLLVCVGVSDAVLFADGLLCSTML